MGDEPATFVARIGNRTLAGGDRRAGVDTICATHFGAHDLSSAGGESGMKIEKITLREIHMKLKSPFETSFGVTHERRIILVEGMADGVTGWGEVTVGETPHFNSETTETAWHVISDFIVPGLMGQQIASAADIPALIQGIRGHQ